MKIRCAHCGKRSDKPNGAVNRAAAIGAPLFCDRTCAGLARRKGKTKAQRVEEKRLYDQAYRAENLAMLKAKKAAYHKRTYDPATAAAYRKKRMPYHVEYCRRPEYRMKKSTYDRHRRAAEYGDFADAFQLTIDLNREIKRRASNEEIKWQNGTANKSQFRKRTGKEGQERGRPRNRWRRPSHSAAVG